MSLSSKNSLFKILYIILDGIGDLPHSSINNRTPLEAANTPNLDNLATNGIMGEVITVGKGIAPQSDIAVFNMLGYNFRDVPYVGRGIVESIGCGIKCCVSWDRNSATTIRRAGASRRRTSHEICFRRGVLFLHNPLELTVLCEL